MGAGTGEWVWLGRAGTEEWVRQVLGSRCGVWGGRYWGAAALWGRGLAVG